MLTDRGSGGRKMSIYCSAGIEMPFGKINNSGERGQDGGRVGGHARPLPQTQQKSTSTE